MCASLRPSAAPEHAVDPRAGGVDERARFHFAFAIFVAEGDGPQAAVGAGGDHFGARHDDGAAVGRIARVEDDEARVVDRAVRIFEGLAVVLAERCAGGIGPEVERAGGGQKLAAAEIVVGEQAEAQHPGRPQALVVGQNEPQRADDVRRHRHQHFALDQRLAHQAEFVMLEIAQAAVDELGGPGRGSGREVGLFGERDAVAAADHVARDAASVDAAADHQNIEGAVFIHVRFLPD